MSFLSRLFGPKEVREPLQPGRSITIDTANQTLRISEGGQQQEFSLYSKQAFEAVSREWVRIGWSLKYYHTFTWMGRPVLQLPEDLVRIQEVIFTVKPDLLIETGVFDGGSLVFYASLFEALGKGRVLGIDIEIRPGTREEIPKHPLAGRMEMLEGDSTSPEMVAKVKALVRPGEIVLVVLDSHHSYAHVAAELEAYAPLVSPGSYIVATDGIMQDLTDVLNGQPSWREDNPSRAAVEFAARHPEFELRQPPWAPNVSPVEKNITYWPDAWLRRRNGDSRRV